ncbi:AsmA family protein [Halomonas urumqiensis]|uniref:AsmA family protein n=1 Tax=Halomonas urumqiensis TaxID=1684789 RepID=A0A2N7ULA3_9GAMM|nr:AsmA family protein [Halomonas urumqiensis]PMR81220.1 AsmA family protein [Halomonas urumqiensis]PTB01769.1 AsmA family protein [Halomonas urumqiensis]GHE22126.1 hypothetical protein GCM10017767_26470 [Halomonas urumqiensis]
MKRLLRTLLAAVGVLALVAVGAVVYVTTFFDPEDLKPRLVEVVREQSGLELALDGPLTWSFYPRLGVSVASAEAWLPEQAVEEEDAFVAFQQAEVSLSFAPILRGEIAIDGLTLDGMRLNLERDEQGRGNWESLMERLAERSEAAEEVLAPASAGLPPGSDTHLTVALNVASVQIRDGEISYRDLSNGTELRLTDASISGSNVNPRRAFPLEAGFRLDRYDELDWEDSEKAPLLSSRMAMKGRVTLNLAERRYVTDGLTLNATSQLEGVTGEQQLNLSGDQLIVDVPGERLSLEGGNLEATLRHPQLGDSALPLAMAFAMDADLAAGSAQLRDLELTGDDGLKVSGNLNLSSLYASPAYSGQISLAPLSLHPWLKRLSMMPTLADESALSDVALTSPLEGNMQGVEFTGLTLVLDDSTFTGELGVGLAGQRLDFDLQGDRLNLDSYMPPEAPAEEGSAALSLPGVSQAYADQPATLLPVEWLSTLDLDGQLTLGRLQLAGLEFSDVSLALSGRDGRQRLVGFESGFYEGELAASGELDLTRDDPHWQLAPRLSRLRIDSLLETLDDQPAPLRGRLNAEGELTSRGNTWPDLKRNLNGNIDTRIDDGAILEVNVSRELCTAAATLEGEQTTRDWHPDTRFERAQASLRFRDGNVNSDDLLITIPGIELGGEGWFDLSSERFEARAAARVVDGADLACRVNPRLERVSFPVRCEGSLDGDSSEWCRFDREAFQASLGELVRDEVTSRAGEEVEQRLERPLQQLEERIGEDAGRELRDTLRGLFN